MERRSDPGESSCTVTASGGVQLVGEHDVATAQEFTTALEEAAKLSAGSLAVDLSRATFVDSSIVAALVRCARELGRAGRGVAIRVKEGSPPALVIDIIGLASQPGIVLETVPRSDGG